MKFMVTSEVTATVFYVVETEIELDDKNAQLALEWVENEGIDPEHAYDDYVEEMYWNGEFDWNKQIEHVLDRDKTHDCVTKIERID